MLCQQCGLPLVPHESLVQLKAAQARLATRNSSKAAPSEYADDSTVYSKLSIGSNYRNSKDIGRRVYGGTSPGESFVVVIPESMKGSSSSQLQDDRRRSDPDDSLGKIASKLENLSLELSAKSDVDYPICTECAELVQKGLESRYKESDKERDTYIRFLNKIKDLPDPGREEVDEITKLISQLENENEKALAQLKTVERQREDAEKELEGLKRQAEELTTQEEQFYKEQNQLYLELADYQDEKDRVDELYEYYTNQLKKLKRIDVYKDMFCISEKDGSFGTINGLRLGRSRRKKERAEKERVEWSEINAALGQTLLLVATVIRTLDFNLAGYGLQPLGSMSRIEKINIDKKTGLPGKPRILKLYKSGNSYGPDDDAMIALLNVLNQLGRYVESCDPSGGTLKPPFEIENDKIGGKRIRVSTTDEDEWTQACRNVLFYAKWLLAYTRSQRQQR
jgi:beclin 1